MILIIWTLLAVLILAGVFVFGRRWERKQIIFRGVKRPTTQDILLRGKK